MYLKWTLWRPLLLAKKFVGQNLISRYICTSLDSHWLLVLQLPRSDFCVLIVCIHTHSTMRSSLLSLAALAGGVFAASCPYMASDATYPRDHPEIEKRATTPDTSTEEFMSQFELNDTDTYMTTDSGTPIQDQNSLKAGPRGPTLLEDFIFRQKIQHFDHERVRSFSNKSLSFLRHSTYLILYLGPRTCRPCERCR